MFSEIAVIINFNWNHSFCLMPEFQITREVFLLLFATGLAAGFVDAIAGGGGLIALPVLLSVGLPPQVALGTNKLQGSFGTFSAAYNFIRKGHVNFREGITGILTTFVGAVLGSWTVQWLEPVFLGRIIPVLLFLVLVYTYFSKNLGLEDHDPKMSRRAFFLLFGLGLGFYDGFFGPGTGSFWMAGFCIFLGFNMTKSAGYTRLMNFTSNIVALSIFIIGGNVLYSVGLCMAGGQLIGARIGSDLAIQNGARFIRPIFMVVVCVTIARLVYLNYR